MAGDGQDTWRNITQLDIEHRRRLLSQYVKPLLTLSEYVLMQLGCYCYTCLFQEAAKPFVSGGDWGSKIESGRINLMKRPSC